MSRARDGRVDDPALDAYVAELRRLVPARLTAGGRAGSKAVAHAIDPELLGELRAAVGVAPAVDEASSPELLGDPGPGWTVNPPPRRHR